ncbi:Centrosome microtubule-binding domain of Cep57 [Teratosphaeria destructans]|uniref:Centrosome microtubule-binding domain of Cep57 n=1 Tax=Teratosphaeria destructans TaxID=418781 RepID=A0A9W7SWB8_9PEZI|nr:Centrosome microtubule-binding domain of Cep57 [Teratosphaeria destructans]
MSRFTSRANPVRTSSPQDDFATANSFTQDQLIHSTLNFDHTARRSLPLGDDEQPEADAQHTAGSADMSMSIELGRGIKRGARDPDADSSDLAIALGGGDSQHEVTGTPPFRPRTASRKSDGLLRREASVRAATSAVKTKQRSISEAIGRRHTVDDDTMQPILSARHTRFTGTRRVSAQDGTPRRAPANNPTVQSATYTANSFALPDMPGLTELVSGDGTPLLTRATKPARTRFTSASYQPPRSGHAPIDSLPIPQDEHRIYNSLQQVKQNQAQLEQDAADAERRADDYQQQVIELRRQLEAERRRPDGALGEDEETAAMKFQQQKSNLQASVNALEQHCRRIERNANTAQIKLQRVKKERDGLIEDVAAALHRSEVLETENQDIQEGYARLIEENELLRQQLQELRSQLNARPAQSQPTLKRRNSEKQTAAARAAQVDKFKGEARGQQALSDATEDLSTRIARAMDRRRQNAGKRETVRGTSTLRSRSQSQPRHLESRRRPSPAPVEDTETTTEMEITQKTRNALSNMYIPSPAKKSQQTHQVEEDTRDVTLLSLQDPLEVANLRKKLEEEHMARKNRRSISNPENVHRNQREDTVRSTNRDATRKSSLKDITAGLENITGRLSLHGDATEAAKKTVRVQSPQQTEEGDISILSNISRRRRRAASQEGMTSAFILPDITFSSHQLPDFNTKSCITHSSASCTVCHPADEKTEIPIPIPVTDRPTPEDPDVTIATVRPAQPPPLALASVLKQLEDEVTHLKFQLAEHQRRYHQHDPALSKRQRLITKSRMDSLTKQIETRSDQIYALYDVLEGQKGQRAEEAVEETLQSLGLDAADLAGRVGRKAVGGDGPDEESSADELPGWEGLSDEE